MLDVECSVLGVCCCVLCVAIRVVIVVCWVLYVGYFGVELRGLFVGCWVLGVWVLIVGC